MYNLSEKAIAEKYEDLLFTKVMALYAAEESEKILSEIDRKRRSVEGIRHNVARVVQNLFENRTPREPFGFLESFQKAYHLCGNGCFCGCCFPFFGSCCFGRSARSRCGSDLSSCFKKDRQIYGSQHWRQHRFY